MRARWLTLALLTGCSQGTYVVVTVDSALPLDGVQAFSVDLTLGSRTAHKRVQPKSLIKLPADFAIEISSGSGQLDVHVDARDASDQTLSSGDGSVQVSSNHTVHLAITLGGVNPGGDLAGLDGNGAGDGGGDGGGPARLQASPDQINLNPTAAAATHARLVTITNVGGADSGALAAAVTGPDAAACVIGLNACDSKILAPGDSCTVQMLITPPVPGTLSATLTVGDSSSHRVTVPLAATAVTGQRLTITKAGNGAGTISAVDIDCGVLCTNLYPPGTTVTMTQTPDVSSNFAGWSVAGCSGATCDVVINGDQTVTVTYTLKPIQITVNLSGAGNVTSTPAGINCNTASCSATFLYGQLLKLTATPPSTSYVSSWSGATCAGGICNSTPTGDTTYGVTFSAKPANFVFTTSVLHNPGDLGGLAGAKTICQDAAASGGLGGTYVPWLSSTTVDAVTGLGTAKGWVRRDLKPFANTIADLTAGKIFYPITLDENGHQPTDTYANSPVTFTQANGIKQFGASSNTCTDYTVANNNSVVGGMFGGGSSEWTNRSSVNCNRPAALLCFGTDVQVAVSPPPRPVGARVMFPLPASVPWDPSTGRANADAKCQTAAAMLTPANSGTFLAELTPDDGHAAWTRFTATGGPWYRPDDVQVVANAVDFLMDYPLLMAGPDVYPDRTYPGSGVSIYALTGRPTQGSNPANTCSNWTVNDSGTYAGAIDVNELNGSNTSSSCTMAAVLCVQN